MFRWGYSVGKQRLWRQGEKQWDCPGPLETITKKINFLFQINHFRKKQYLYDWSHKYKKDMGQPIFSPLFLWANKWVHPILENNFPLMKKEIEKQINKNAVRIRE